LKADFVLLIVVYVDSSVDKSKRNVVEIKGRFSVTSENVDLAKVSELGGCWIHLMLAGFKLNSVSYRKFNKSLLSRFRRFQFQSAVSPVNHQR
jgi:predicted SpoU family rRNA methylase